MAPRLLSGCFGSRGVSRKHHDQIDDDATPAEENRRGSPVVLELFSSQGCAASPEAELLFSRIGRGDFNLDRPLILLAYHVDYWDYTGWKDPFGSSQWTVRQKAYVEALNLDTIFTPQVVVQGRDQCMGNEEEALLSYILGAHRFPAPAFQAKFQRSSSPPDTLLQVSFTGSLRTKVDHEGVSIMVALYECGLVTDCTAGVNNGRVLPGEYVVRRLEKLCSVKDVSVKKTLAVSVSFSLWEGFNAGKCGIALFVEHPSHRILGSQKFSLPENL
ncbi:hypothetical protein M569_07886 [Genlisea aurea]|uniref:Uncharacterized protein n=1 Tax=Genlisea aurea TaxID=192259 RepID=S8CIS8_9LAMI|nr:hypothetical protein M569_07886 [Genlisea aurea]